MTNLSQFNFTATEFLRSDAPLPVTGIRPLVDRSTKAVTGSIFSIVIPARNFVQISVKVAGSNAHETYQQGTSIQATFHGLLVRPYAMVQNGQLLAGWSATADSVELVKGGELYL